MNRTIRTLAALAALILSVALPASGQSSASAPKKQEEAKPAKEMTHWITLKSGVRHNSRCRYYQNSKGRPCTKDEGRACKICGG